MGIISVDRPTVATGNLCLYLYNSRPQRIRAVRIYIRILLGPRKRRVRKQTIWHKWHVVEWPDPWHQIWAGAAMVEPPARCSVAQIPTYTTSWTVLSTQIPTYTTSWTVLSTQIPTYTTSWTVLSTQIWELCLMYIHVHHLYYLHAHYYTCTSFTLYKSLMIFYRVMLLYLYPFNAWWHAITPVFILTQLHGYRWLPNEIFT